MERSLANEGEAGERRSSTRAAASHAYPALATEGSGENEALEREEGGGFGDAQAGRGTGKQEKARGEPSDRWVSWSVPDSRKSLRPTLAGILLSSSANHGLGGARSS